MTSRSNAKIVARQYAAVFRINYTQAIREVTAGQQLILVDDATGITYTATRTEPTKYLGKECLVFFTSSDPSYAATYRPLDSIGGIRPIPASLMERLTNHAHDHWGLTDEMFEEREAFNTQVINETFLFHIMVPSDIRDSYDLHLFDFAEPTIMDDYTDHARQTIDRMKRMEEMLRETPDRPHLIFGSHAHAIDGEFPSFHSDDAMILRGIERSHVRNSITPPFWDPATVTIVRHRNVGLLKVDLEGIANMETVKLGVAAATLAKAQEPVQNPELPNRWFNRADTWIDRSGIEHRVDDMTHEQLMVAMIHLVTRVRLIHFIEVKSHSVGTAIPSHPYYRYELPLDFTPEYEATTREGALAWLYATPVYRALNNAINARSPKP